MKKKHLGLNENDEKITFRKNEKNNKISCNTKKNLLKMFEIGQKNLLHEDLKKIDLLG